MHLRKASRKDLDAASSLFAELIHYESRFDKRDLNKELRKFKKRFLSKLNEEDYICLIVYDKEAAVAFADVHNKDIFGIDKEAGYVRNVFVKKEYRKRGVGRLIFKNILRWMKQQRKHKVVLDAYSKNKHAIAAWKALGFHATEKHRKFTRMEK